MNHRKIILLLAGIIFLTGCAHSPPHPTFKYIPWKERKVKLQQNKTWIINGSLSITHNNKRDTARFKWEQNKNDYIITISEPMNLGSAKIIGNLNQVEFCQSNHKCVHAQSSEQLLFNQIGWQLPISNLKRWILALPTPTKIEATRFDQYGHLVALEQQGWKIYYSDFQSIKNVDLANIIELQNKKFFIKLRIKNYFFLPN